MPTHTPNCLVFLRPPETILGWISNVDRWSNASQFRFVKNHKYLAQHWDNFINFIWRLQASKDFINSKISATPEFSLFHTGIILTGAKNELFIWKRNFDKLSQKMLERVASWLWGDEGWSVLNTLITVSVEDWTLMLWFQRDCPCTWLRPRRWLRRWRQRKRTQQQPACS